MGEFVKMVKLVVLVAAVARLLEGGPARLSLGPWRLEFGGDRLQRW